MSGSGGGGVGSLGLLMGSELAVLSRAVAAKDGKGISINVWNYNNGKRWGM